MAVVIVAPSIVRYTFHHAFNSTMKSDNIMDVSVDPVGLLASRDASVDDFNSHVCGYWQDAIMPLFPSSVHFLGASWIDLNSSTGRTGTLGPAGGHPSTGSATGNVGALQVCALMHKHTTSGRGTRPGRTFISPVTEEAVDPGGAIAPAAQTVYNTALNAFRTSVSGWATIPGATAAIRVVHVHKLDKDNPTTWTWSSSDVSSFTCDSVVGTQRQRQRP